MGSDDDMPQWPKSDKDGPHARSPQVSKYAIGGLSLEDFQQDEALKQAEAAAQAPAQMPSPEASRLSALARYRTHIWRERKRAESREHQTVLDGNGRRAGPRDASKRRMGDTFPCDPASMFGEIRRENTRHPKRTLPHRPQTTLRCLIERIVDEGLIVPFLQDLAAHMKARACQDAGLVRLYLLLTSSAGFDAKTMRPIEEVDDDLMLKSGDNKRAAELLTELGYASTVRDVENTKKRLDRCLLDIGTKLLNRMALIDKTPVNGPLRKGSNT